MCFVVTCWERADLLALVCGVFCEFVTFPLVSWVRCGTWLYRFLIFATLLLCLGVISEAEDHSVWYAFPSGVDFPKCHREIAASLNDFSGNWCGRENVEPDALKELTINIFGIIDIHALFLLALYTFLPPGPWSFLRRLKHRIQIFHILRKTIEGYWNSFDFKTFGNIIFKQIIFVIDRIITMQITKMQIEIHRSLVTIQYYTKCTNPLYPKFTSKKLSALKFCWNLYQVIAYVLIPTTDKS